MKKRAALIAGCCLAVFVAGAVLYGLPYGAVYRIISALQSRDAGRIANVIDFPRVQAGMKDQIRASLPPSTGGGDWDRVRQAMASKLFDAAVEQMVTPEGLAAIFSKNVANAMGDGKPLTEDPKTAAASYSTIKIFAVVLRYADCSYLSSSEFAVAYDDRQGGRVRFLLYRFGLQWRLVHIQIPLPGNQAK